MGLDFASICKVLNKLILKLIFHDCKDLKSLDDLLLLHDYILSRDKIWGQ